MKPEKINKTIQKYGNAAEHLMLILRDLEVQSGKNELDVADAAHASRNR